ncbi:zf-HC2 domain-containing protein [Corynebacterium sp. ES2794-CONJ1]|uniref:zf-HC2 domain-containing protein n=1 Tax=unclassified Corynebacterium TaxID=2624378 RepID=UPI0021696497|nr:MULTISPECIES: zf-HC2 domain-containing protein [unclassified Corynebacterium]MCS4490005.1 zf-HC2 domain-containing protein [Corynebacterium sp. ES2775-CONJ]MCS4491632.1 zf-HC2 domain-containing protein [Corynebacterium sp. ES2715-CONJ3]MCS4531737.1 zf-HC2 domain-containing protein [Corynebacterium sp. ES2730-CONJ]MCU9519133.1 zf-HC2 domain-containing protein [Corynebacterium sp. ES2794-CONJ1]
MLNCDKVQAALSARLDGEAFSLNDEIVDAHLIGCEQCRHFLEQAALMNRRLAFNENLRDRAPDLSAIIIHGVESEWRRHASARIVGITVSRVFIAVTGLFWVFWALFLLGDVEFLVDDPLMSRVVVEAAAMRLSLGFGLFFASWQYRLIAGILPVYGAAWMFSFGFATREIVVGTINYDALAQLALLLFSVVALAGCWFAERGWELLELGRRSL